MQEQERQLNHPRRHLRYRTSLSLTVSMLGQNGSCQMSGLCNQISEGGITAIVSSELAISELVTLTLAIPPNFKPMTLRALVRWRDRLQHGLEFFALSAEQSAEVQRFCKELSAAGQLE